MPGREMMCGSPVRASTMNQTTMTGPNSRPMRWVPSRCTKNNPTTMAMPIGSTTSCAAGATTSMPSTADSTEIAGVIRLSP